MAIQDYKNRASKYFVDDIKSAIVPSTPLSNTLKKLEAGDKAISQLLIMHLQRKELFSLLAYIKREYTFTEYLGLAKQEQVNRIALNRGESIREDRLHAEKQLKITLASKAKKKAADEKQRAYQNDPRNIAKAKQLTLREKYGLEYFIEQHDFPKLIKILQKIDNKIRLTEKDVVWLNLDGSEYFTEPLKIAFHGLEAGFYANKFKKEKDPWLAVNASSHYRKCDKPQTADQLLNTIKTKTIKNKRLKSAVYTTHGGVKRDLGNKQYALTLGEMAHKLTSKDFRPCTLLGAVNMESGSYELGQLWYKKAIENGFSEKAMDSELRQIYFRLSKSQKDALRRHLHGIDASRYKWAK